MRRTKHTRGPWRWKMYVEGERLVGPRNRAVAAGYGGDDGAPVVRGGIDVSGADARLIAAAPDLLDALEGIVVNQRAHGHVDESWWQAAEAAIARAKGTW